MWKMKKRYSQSYRQQVLKLASGMPSAALAQPLGTGLPLVAIAQPLGTMRECVFTQMRRTYMFQRILFRCSEGHLIVHEYFNMQSVGGVGGLVSCPIYL